MKKTAVAFLVFLAGAGVSHASLISWTSTPYTVNGAWGQYLDTGLFVTSGTQILAENVGGAATTFDSINFSAGTITFNGGTYNGFHDTNVPSPLLSRTGTYGTTVPDTVSLTGLTNGYSYRIQALVYDGRGDVGIPGRTVKFDGTSMGQYANGVSGVTWGNGLLVTGTFTANATTQNFTVEAFTSGGASRGGQLNALLVHQTAIPEPSAAMLGGLSILGLWLRRRRGLQPMQR